MKKVFASVIASVGIITTLAVSLFFINARLGDGIEKIKIMENGSNEKVLSIEYGRLISENSHYSIRIMDKDEKVFLGNRLVEDDGTLGEHRVEIMFYDVRGSKALAKKYPLGKVHKLKDVPVDLTSQFNIRMAYPPDDSLFVVYMGSDDPINIKEQDITRLDRARRRIEFALGK